MKKSDLVLTLGQRLLLLFLSFIICYMLTIACSFLLGRVLSENLPAALRISSLAQDVIAFILPAIITVLLVTRKPAELLCLTRRPTLLILLSVVIIMFVFFPLEENIIYWNYNISLPESMKGFEEMARQMESAANGSMKILLGNGSISSLILNVLIIGVAAAFAEELLFRGCLLRLLTTGGVNRHIAVWTVAILFSAMHMQFFGFVPRMLLGAYFGYLLLWTGSLWVPITAHFLNNAVYVVVACRQVRTSGVEVLDAEPTAWPLWAMAASIIATAAALYFVYSYCKKLRA